VSRCYSPSLMAADSPVKALLISIGEEPGAAIFSINRLKPENLCFFLSPSAKPLVETTVQPHINQMPRRWDWVVTQDPYRFGVCYQILVRALPEMMRTWEVQPGELVLDMSGATPAMAAAMMAPAGPELQVGRKDTRKPAPDPRVTSNESATKSEPLPSAEEKANVCPSCDFLS
jgi:hypothetical protein